MKSTKKPSVKKPVQPRKSKKVAAVVDEIIVPQPPAQEVSATQPEPVLDLDNPIYERPTQLLVIVLVLGWMFDFLFWKQGIGVNFSIFLTVCLLGGVYWLLSNKILPAKNSLWLLIPFLFFAVITFLKQEPLTISLAFTFTLLSAGLLASSYVGGRWYQYKLSDYVYKFFLLIGDMISASISYFYKAQRIQDKTDSGKSGFPIWAMLRGLLIALPIVVCFGSLLAAGDVVFKEKLDEFLELDDLSENIFRITVILFYAYLLAGTFIHSALKSGDDKLMTEDKPSIKPFIGFTESAVILGSVSILFLAFVVVQFQYFFGGETNIGVEGYTYSQYARRGFNELITVAFFSLVMILGLSTVTKRENEAQKKMYSGLSVALVSFVLVILVSAYQRISLSIGWHGFSRLRLYPRIFLIWLAVLFVAVVVLEIIRKERFFTFAAVLASVGFAVSLTFVNIDAAIVKHNIPRTLHGKNLNVGHLASLSLDAVPSLTEAFYSNSYPQSIHEGIGAILTCYLYYDSKPGAYDNDWRSFNFSRWQAHIALDEVEPSLQSYSILDDDYPLQIRTPGNELYECREYSNREEE